MQMTGNVLQVKNQSEITMAIKTKEDSSHISNMHKVAEHFADSTQ